MTKSFCADSVPKDQSSKGLGRRGRGVLSQACSTTLVGSLSLPAQVYRGWSTAAVARPDSPGMRSPASHTMDAAMRPYGIATFDRHTVTAPTKSQHWFSFDPQDSSISYLETMLRDCPQEPL